MSNKKVILLGINEINFDYINYYINQGKLPNFKELLHNNQLIETTSEDEYHLLEPWIQWVTLYTGKSYEEHQVFRLGDIVNRPDLSQLFEELEAEGKTVGAISPFNADNRLKNPVFFVPDPWTKTKVSGNGLLKSLSDAVQQTVNDNAQSKLRKRSLASIMAGVLKYVSPNRYAHFLQLFFNKNKPGVKAIVLDSLLADIFEKLWKKNQPDFSYLFLNAGAHIQHHYLFNSAAYDGEFKNPQWYCEEDYDPLINVLEEYDRVIGELMSYQNAELVVATGLHQKPHKHLTYYWRLKNHREFLKNIGITDFKDVLPRMSRDFLIELGEEPNKNKEIQEILESYIEPNTGEKIFTVDNRGDSLFMELVYPNDIDDDMKISSSLTNITIENFKQYVAFVAIKNGEHDGIGYLISTADLGLENKVPLTSVKESLKQLTL